MPNHIATEIRFTGLSPEMIAAVTAKVTNEKGAVDFETLLPVPLNLWWHSTGKRHTETFPGSALDWCTQNWSTKWNAYGARTAETREDGTLVLTFQTAWSVPYGWMVAIFNSLKVSFDYDSLNEGESHAISGRFDYAATGNLMSDPWKESKSDDATNLRMHHALWGDAAEEILSERSAHVDAQ